MSQQQLLHEVWGPEYHDESAYLRVHMANLRRKLEPEPSRPRYFLTEPGMGYRFQFDASLTASGYPPAARSWRATRSDGSLAPAGLVAASPERRSSLLLRSGLSARNPMRSATYNLRLLPPSARSAVSLEPTDSTTVAEASARLERTLFEVKRIIVGQDRMVERLMVCLLARGHCLLEGVPGLAKTLAAETLASTVQGTFARIQFTPDLMPSDLVGTRIYRPSTERSTSSSARCSPTSCSPTRSTVRPPRCSRRCSRSWPSTRCRSPGSRIPCPTRSSCSPRRTRSSPRACTCCPKRSATASS